MDVKLRLKILKLATRGLLFVLHSVCTHWLTVCIYTVEIHCVSKNVHLFMAALHSRCRHYILQLFFLLLSFFLLFFLTCSQRSQIGCLSYFYTWCGPSANLECMYEMCCIRLAENTGRKKSPSGHRRTTLSGYIFTTEACIKNWKTTC